MKIKVEGEKIVRAVKKLEGIEIVVENAEDAREGLHLLLERIRQGGAGLQARIKDIQVTAHQHYETSAVQYKTSFITEFLFEEGTSLQDKVGLIRELQICFQTL